MATSNNLHIDHSISLCSRKGMRNGRCDVLMSIESDAEKSKYSDDIVKSKLDGNSKKQISK